ncbi:HTH-type transcriptional regulator DmlR [BD1-7 clade bacterium]|nr:HTH-type transcriptional regulator DmlR [BD1-7 clade bacterium]
MQTDDLVVVLKVAEFRNITAAAADLDMQPATASAAIKRIEKQLGAELFIRTTRQLRVSAAGEYFIPQCKEALQMLERAQQSVKTDLDIIDGEIRMAVSSDLGRNLVLPWLDAFMVNHPSVSVRVNVSDSNVDFYRDSVDVALRYGSPTDASLYGFKICDVPAVLCASPAYLKEYGTPSHPQDLIAHNGLFYQLHDVTHDIWSFTREGEAHKVKVSGNRASNDGDLVRRWCVAGKGVAVKSCLDLSGDLLAGRLVGIMPDYQPRSSELWLICPSKQSITPAVRLLRDMLKTETDRILSQLRGKHLLSPAIG